MNGYTVFVLAFGPGIFWLWYFYKKDKLEPEPKSLILRTFFFGMLMVIPAGMIEHVITMGMGTYSLIVLTVIVAPVVEEYCKYFVVRRTVFNHTEFDEPMDGIVYAAAAALGFASLENLVYVGSTYFAAQTVAGADSIVAPVLGISVTRAVFSVPGHVLFSVMWGSALGAVKFMPGGANKRKGYIYAGLILAMILHGVFNMLAQFPFALVFLLAFMAIAWGMVQKRITIALVNSPHGRPVPYPPSSPDSETE